MRATTPKEFDFIRKDGKDASGVEQTSSRFESMNEFLEHCEARVPAEPGGATEASARLKPAHGCYLCKPDKYKYGHPTTGEDDWYSSGTFEEALQQARDGSDYGIVAMKRYLATLSTRLGERIRQPDYTMGVLPRGGINMGSYISGVPSIYVTAKENWATAPSQDTALLYVHICFSCGVDSDVIARRGAVALALASLLEQAGKPTRIVLCGGIQATRAGAMNGHSLYVTFKDYGQAIHLGRASFALCNSGMFRRLAFAHMERFPEGMRQKFGVRDCGGYGSPMNVREIPEEAIVFHHGSWNEQWATPEGAKQYVEDLLRKRGVEFIEDGSVT
jgi:hypothetical protein